MKKCTLIIAFALSLVSAPMLAQEMREVTDDTGTSVDIPAQPERIVALHDTSLTVALVELGVLPVGSHGRSTSDGVPFIRSGKLVTGTDFDNSDIAFVGNLPADLEAIAALEPDLILTTTWQSAGVEQLRRIAPTYVFDIDRTDDFDVYRQIAVLTGTEDRLARLETRYRTQLDTLNTLVDTSQVQVSVIQGHAGELLVWKTYGSLGKVLRDAGFRFPEIVDRIEGNGRQAFSGESFPEFDADFIFVTYRPSRGESPQTARAALDDVLPGWCNLLQACRNGNVVYLPRELASSATYDSLFALTEIVASHVVGRE